MYSYFTADTKKVHSKNEHQFFIFEMEEGTTTRNFPALFIIYLGQAHRCDAQQKDPLFGEEWEKELKMKKCFVRVVCLV
ncbi:hypothetical protein RV12_GL002082 [Enterococcus quebecensis]|nr:hypothetical protein RV12_GL002082 [Enterococcus quebecensis]